MNDKLSLLVKFQSYKTHIGIRTITRQAKSPQTFYLPHLSFTDLEASGCIVLRDSYSFAEFELIDGGATVKIDFTWLTQYGDKTAKGYAQTVYLDYDALANRIWDSLEGNHGPKAWSMLSVERSSRRPKLDFSSPGAQKTIREVLAVPVLRHKLTRAVRDNFQWPDGSDHVVRFYADYDRYSFFFQEYRDGKEGICGGLILEHYDGLAKAKYGVHT